VIARAAETGRRSRVCSEHFGNLRYQRVTDKLGDLPRGTCMFGETVIWGYPSIGRILRLESGLREQFCAPLWVEEKMDGYNVRICQVAGRVLALTRGGFVCPFTLDRLADLMDLRILDEHPELVVCAEVAGPENPYLHGHPPRVAEDVALFVFDLMRRGMPGYLPQREKLALIERYGLPAAPVLGHFQPTEWRRIGEILQQLNASGGEGVVLKEDSARSHRAKYVTSNSSISDIRLTIQSIKQLPPEYFINRVLRLVLFLDEQQISRDRALAEGLGDAFLDGLFSAIEQVKHEHRVYERYRCRFRDRRNAERLLRRIRAGDRHIQVVQRSLERVGDYYVLEFDKVLPNMTGLLGHVMSGGLVYD